MARRKPDPEEENEDTGEEAADDGSPKALPSPEGQPFSSEPIEGEIVDDDGYDEEYQFSFFPNEEQRFHNGKPIMGRELRFTGRASITGAFEVHQALWENLQGSDWVAADLVLQYAADGFEPRKASDGEIIGYTEFKRVKVVHVHRS